MRIHMHDQSKTHLPRPHGCFGPWLVLGIIAAIGLGAMIANAARAEPTPQCSVTGVTTDNLMSPERAEYMMLFEHGQEFTEYDLQ